ncbi:MAG: hypothetical protein LBH68_03100 [Bifidobacteriaceae bacterium]|jgi:hypothetical protein|nr:hypothetical protein [Bifidobacteriaceae bacterium]
MSNNQVSIAPPEKARRAPVWLGAAMTVVGLLSMAAGVVIWVTGVGFDPRHAPGAKLDNVFRMITTVPDDVPAEWWTRFSNDHNREFRIWSPVESPISCLVQGLSTERDLSDVFWYEGQEDAAGLRLRYTIDPPRAFFLYCYAIPSSVSTSYPSITIKDLPVYVTWGVNAGALVARFIPLGGGAILVAVGLRFWISRVRRGTS